MFMQNDVDEDEFNEYKEALIEEKLERDHSLVDETDRHWEQIWDQRYSCEFHVSILYLS
jgi:secreted Zn-dependent insulinase-like peptidase